MSTSLCLFVCKANPAEDGQGCMVYVHTENPTLDVHIFEGIEIDNVVWCILCPFGNFHALLVYFVVIWYFFPFWYVVSDNTRVSN
jgi:hypothetical protein